MTKTPVFINPDIMIGFFGRYTGIRGRFKRISYVNIEITAPNEQKEAEITAPVRCGD